jgi:hypothetical protein
MQGMTKYNKDGSPRKINPKSLANLAPQIKPGQVLNPTGKSGKDRPYTDAMQWYSGELMHEHLRIAMNLRFKNQLYHVLKALPEFATMVPADIPDLYPKGCSWAQANAVRQHMAAILEGNIMAAIECREAVEGRATTRVEFVSQNDKLESLLNAFRAAAKQPVIDVPVLPAGITGPSGNGNTGNTNGNR